MEEEAISLARDSFIGHTIIDYSSLKPCQKSAVKAFISGKDMFLSLPTRYGKSFCYCCLPWVFDTAGNAQCWAPF